MLLVLKKSEILQLTHHSIAAPEQEDNVQIIATKYLFTVTAHVMNKIEWLKGTHNVELSKESQYAKDTIFVVIDIRKCLRHCINLKMKMTLCKETMTHNYHKTSSSLISIFEFILVGAPQLPFNEANKDRFTH